ncbi:Uncharacterised protein [Enterobacter cancerogenus]|uniref:Uncharacterized protein n=1 Tax=Enterobacter cancerogenus TaxID=69218 RepID=A0A484Z3F1_9ENTR|nr:Uncharacterised protein [Enterobacter cancerogenus]
MQPNLVQIVLDLAAEAQIVNQNVGIRRQSLLMQADMAIRINVNNGEHVIALGNELARQRIATVRQIEHYPAIMALLFQTLQSVAELRKQGLMRIFVLAFCNGQLSVGEQIQQGGVTQARVLPLFTVEECPRPAVLMAEVDVERHAQQIVGAGINDQHRFTQ